MIILESSNDQHERSPLKKAIEIDVPIPSAAPATMAPPPYAPTAIPHPNPLPPYQTIIPHHHVRRSPHRRSALRRLLRAFAVACLILLLWGIFIKSIAVRSHPSKRRRPDYGYTLDTFRIGSHHLHRVCEDCPSQQGIDGLTRVLPIQYPPPQITGSLDHLP